MALPTFVGCFSSSQPLFPQGYAKFQSSGHCNDICTGNDRLVLGLSNGTQCWCGDELPQANSKVQRSNCDTPCQGYDLEDCGGGNNFFTVWLTKLGTESNNPIPNYKGSTATSSNNKSPVSTATSSTGTRNNGRPPTSTTASSRGSAQQTRPGRLAPGSETADNNSSKGHSDATVAIAVGVIIGFVALSLLIFVLWWTWRRRRRTGSFARFERSVDDSSAALQPRQMAQPVPTTGLTALPAMVQAKSKAGPAILLYQPTTPASATVSKSQTAAAAPAALVAPAAVATREDTLRPAAVSKEVSLASLTADPFYTPLDKPSISHLNQSELNALKAQAPPREDSLSSEFEEEEEDDDDEDEEDSDTLSPLENVRAPEQKNSRNLLYSSSGETDAFEFAGPGTSPLPGTVPGYFPVGHDNGGSRESVWREDLA